MKLRLFSFAVGFISAGIGVGGGAIMVPTFMSFFHFDFRKAASTSLAVIMPISLIGALGHMLLSKHHLPAIHLLLFVPSCIAGAIAAGSFLQSFKTRYLKIAFALFLAVSGLRMLEVYDASSALFDTLQHMPSWGSLATESIFGMMTGFTASLLGVGCGLIIVPFFVIVVGLGIHTAITLSLATMFFLTLTATIVHKKHKALCSRTIRAAIPAALLGAIAGAIASNGLPGHLLKIIFGIFLLIMSVKFLAEELLPAWILARKGAQP